MKDLNLVYPEKSDIKYKIQSFPDGQQNIVLDFNIFEDIRANNKIQGYSHQVDIHRNYEVTIKSRLNNWKDLELIVCAVASLKECQVPIIHLYTPYIMGARSDRKFEDGGNNYLKDVICPIINSLNFNSVTVLDPHSDCLEMGIKNYKKESNLELVKFSIGQIYGFNNPLFTSSEFKTIQKEFILISPDAGASKKIFKLAEQIGYEEDIITCNKDRDTEGKLSKVNVPVEDSIDIKKDFIIIDDICDGGATFINIAKVLKEKWITGKIYLVVTHGIFSKGLNELKQYYDGIYSSNSYSDYNSSSNNNSDNIGVTTKFNFKQLNVF